MNVEKILKIIHPEDLFPNDLDKAKEIYHELSRQWHPDTNKNTYAGDVFAHINSLYHTVIKKIEDKTWCEANTVKITGINGLDLSFKYSTKLSFDLGELYVTPNKIVYILKEPPFNTLKSLKGLDFKYFNSDMEKEFSKCLPCVNNIFLTKDNSSCVVVMNSDLLPLRLVWEYYKKSLDPKHVAWIMSRLYNIACYLQYSKRCHCEISMDSIFIDPKMHSAALLGGWWYSIGFDQKLNYVSSRTNSLLQTTTRKSKIPSPRVDLELIKALGRELLGDPWGTRLALMNIPSPMAQWLKTISGDDAMLEYKMWSKVLIDSFGPRKFVEMNLTAEMLYN